MGSHAQRFAFEENEYPTLEQLLEMLDPNNAGDTAYVLHASDDEARKGKASQMLANAEIKRLAEIKTRSGSVEDMFVSQMRRKILSHGGAITRLKLDWQDDRELAAQIRESDNRDQLQSLKTAGLSKLLVKLGIFGLLGYYFPFVGEGKLSQSPEFVAAMFAIGGYVILSLIQWLRTRRIPMQYHLTVRKANREYAVGKARVFDEHWQQYCEIYAKFSGTKYEREPWYRNATQGDILSEDVWDRRFQMQSMKPVKNTLVSVRRFMQINWRQLGRSRD